MHNLENRVVCITNFSYFDVSNVVTLLEFQQMLLCQKLESIGYHSVLIA